MDLAGDERALSADE